MNVIQYLTGSTVYGTSLGNSDRDLIQVYIPTAADTIMGRISNTHKIKDEDISRYPLSEFTKMLANGSPSVFPYLFTPSCYVESEHHIVAWIRANRAWFVSQKAIKAMLGMSHNQLKTMKSGVTGKMGEKRKELVADVGYDSKAAYHAIRIAAMAAELADTGYMNVDRTWIDANFLINVRRGGVTMSDIEALVDSATYRAERDMKYLTLEPDYANIEQRTVESILYFWRHETYEI